MTEAEKITRVQTLLGNDEEATSALLTIYLDDAKNAILNRIYPFGIPDNAEMPERYESIQCKLAQRYFLRRGAEGEITHNENGVNRSYGSVDDEDLFKTIVPIAKAIGVTQYATS